MKSSERSRPISQCQSAKPPVRVGIDRLLIKLPSLICYNFINWHYYHLTEALNYYDARALLDDACIFYNTAAMYSDGPCFVVSWCRIALKFVMFIAVNLCRTLVPTKSSTNCEFRECKRELHFNQSFMRRGVCFDRQICICRLDYVYMYLRAVLRYYRI